MGAALTVKGLLAMQAGERVSAGRSVYVRRNSDLGFTATIRARKGQTTLERNVMTFTEPSRAVLEQMVVEAERARAEIRKTVVVKPLEPTDKAQGLTPSATLGEVYAAYAEASLRNGVWNERNLGENRKRIDRHLKPSPLWRRKIGTVTALDVADLIAPIRRVTPDQAAKLMGLLKGTFTHAVAARVITDSPMYLAKDLVSQVKRTPKAHFAALTDPSDLQDLMRRIEDMGQASGAVRDALKFQLLTAQRTSEVLGAKWSEIDIERGVWVIPRARMKIADGHRPDHCVPLASQTVQWLKGKRDRWLAGKPKGDGLVFRSPRSKSEGAPTDDAVTKAMRVTLGMAGKHVPHGARASIRTLATRAMRDDGTPLFQVQWIESLLDHAPGTLTSDPLRGAYDRGGHEGGMRAIVQWWADMLLDGRPA